MRQYSGQGPCYRGQCLCWHASHTWPSWLTLISHIHAHSWKCQDTLTHSHTLLVRVGCCPSWARPTECAVNWAVPLTAVATYFLRRRGHVGMRAHAHTHPHALSEDIPLTQSAFGLWPVKSSVACLTHHSSVWISCVSSVCWLCFAELAPVLLPNRNSIKHINIPCPFIGNALSQAQSQNKGNSRGKSSLQWRFLL